MSKNTIVAGGRELGFRFDVQAWMEIEEAFGSLGAMYTTFGGDSQPMGACMSLAAFTANAWMRHMDYPADITREWLVANLGPKQSIKATKLAKDALVVGMRRECDDDEDEDIDVVLAEESKKKEKSAPATA